MDIELRVKKTLMDILHLSDGDNIKKDQISDWDSLKHLDIIFALEEEFNISFNPDEFHLLYSVEDIVKSVRKKIEA